MMRGNPTRFYIIVLALLVFISLAWASPTVNEKINPKLVSQMGINVSISGSVLISGDVDRVTLNITIPQNTSYQEVHCNSTISKYRGVSFAKLEYIDPKESFNYSIVCNVKSSESKLVSIPTEYDLTPYMDYAKPSDEIPSDDPQIKSLALNITSGASNDFEKLAKLTHWVHEYITYNETMVGKYLDAYTILKERKGVCVEYSTLFATLARSLGYPTRFVGGLAYGDEGFTGHMWVEVYLGKWVPFDPTWDLGGSLDATHIAFYRSNERRVQSSIKALTLPGASVVWQPSLENQLSFGKVDIISYKEGGSPIAYSFVTPVKNLAFDVPTFVLVNLTSDRFLITDVMLAKCTGDHTVFSIPDEKKVVFLKPGVPKLVFWRVMPGKLPKGYVYKCPLTINSDFFAPESTLLTVKEGEGPSMQVNISKTIVGVDEAFYVHVTSRSPDIYIYFDNKLYHKTGKDVTFELRSSYPGIKPLLITSGLGGLLETQINVITLEKVRIKNIEFPDTALVGQSIPITLELENPLNKTVPVEVGLDVENQSMKKVVEVEKRRDVGFSLNFSDPGYKQVGVFIRGGDFLDTSRIVIKVIPKPDVSLKSQKVSGDTVLLNFEEEGNPINVTVSVDGEEKKYTKVFAVKLKPGQHIFELRWKDELGNDYHNEFTISIVKKKSLVGQDIFDYAFLVAAVLVLIVGLVAMVLLLSVLRR